MNILQKFKEEESYISLLKHHKSLESEAIRREKESIEKICNYFEKITKTNAYKYCLLKTFENDPYHAFLHMAEMSIMIQALNSRNFTIAEDWFDDYNIRINYDNSTFDFSDKVCNTIEEVFEDYRYDNSLSDLMYFTLNMSSKPQKKYSYSSHIRVTKENIAYEDANYYEVYNVDKRFERAIRAVYQCYLEIKNELETLFERLIDEDRIDF